MKMIPGVSYQKIDDDGLHVVINGETQVLAVDNVVICAGQEPNRALAQPLIDSGKTVHLIGGCDVAMELDARRQLPREHGWRWRFKSLFEAPDATHPARRVNQ